MTKKDYEAFASVIKDNFRSYGYSTDEYEEVRINVYNEAIEDIAKDLLVVFELDNPRFDRFRFLEACGIRA